jgi:hypothetical protein
MAESIDSYFIAPSIQRVTSSRLVVVGDIEIMVPFIAALALELASLMMTILDPVMRVSITDDVPKIPLTLDTLIWSP